MRPEGLEPSLHPPHSSLGDVGLGGATVRPGRCLHVFGRCIPFALGERRPSAVDAVGIEPTTDTRHQLNRLITLMGCRLNGVGNALPTMLRIHPVLERTGNLDGESGCHPWQWPHSRPISILSRGDHCFQQQMGKEKARGSLWDSRAAMCGSSDPCSAFHSHIYHVTAFQVLLPVAERGL